VRTLILTSLTLIAFASNSLLTRGALGHGLIDAPTFTLIRLATGALALAAIGWLRSSKTGQATDDRGAWSSALALAGYAVGFTLAYVRIGASVGALLLFGAVQVTMIGVGVARGERPLRRDWAGLALALGGLAWLTLPGASAPDPLGALLMIAAGACWGAYSIAGRRSRNPLAATGGNFWRATVLAALALGALASPTHASAAGIGLAAVSGAVASGVGYTMWYSVLPALGAWRAALVQLPVPVLTGLGAAVFLGESITLRLAVAGGLVGAGVWLSLRRSRV
jgi:drug/metabolite transporter (DMT)-like permease